MKNNFIRKKLRQIRLDLEDLLGHLSIEELTTNLHLIRHYQDFRQLTVGSGGL